MKRIPYTDANGNQQKNGVYGNLLATSRIMMARYGKKPIITTANFPHSLSDWALTIKNLTKGADTGLTKEEKRFFLARMWQLMTSSPERRAWEYESIGWWQYTQADRFSEIYQKLLVDGLTRTLVASRAKTASTKTGGNILLQLVYTTLNPLGQCDRILNGPTNEKWLDPWRRYLEEKGATFFMGFHASGFEMDAEGNRITSALVKGPDKTTMQVEGDFFILATPVERAAQLISDRMLAADKNLAIVKMLSTTVSWMNGIQFYLNEDVRINQGHVIYSYSEWAVTSISQQQFWKDYDLKNRYNGKIKGILSVDVSDWLYSRFNGKLARECSKEEVAKCVWEQLKKSLNVDGNVVLRDDMIEFFYVDSDIHEVDEAGDELVMENKEPLLVNTVDSWRFRPNSHSQIPNFFMAADYVRTHTDLATMEGANEAARRAVNNILNRCGISNNHCKVWPLQEPYLFLPFHWYDRYQFRRDQEYSAKFPFWVYLLMIPLAIMYAVLYFLLSIVALFYKR